MTWLRVIRRHERSQATVEFALVSVILFLLVLGAVDVGRAVGNYNTLAHATREGIRYAIVHGASSSDPSGPGSPYYTPPNTDTKVTGVVETFGGNLDLSQLTVETEWLDGTNEAGNRVKVTSQYTYEPAFGFLDFLSIGLSNSSTMRITH